MSAQAHDEHEEHVHHWGIYVGIGAFLAIVTGIELGPLFDWYNIPVVVLLGMSAMKFFIVVAFFMHLWDDAPIFTRMFAPPLVGATLMVMVLMVLFNGYNGTNQEDSFAVQERYWSNYSSECTSWLRSSRTGLWYCASPAIDMARMVRIGGGGPEWGSISINLDAASDPEKLAGLTEFGEKIYGARCASCHQGNGLGNGGYPPLAGAGEFYGTPVNHARIVVHGLANVPINVLGVDYAGNMPAQKDMSDVEIAAVLTYVRHSWGNNDGMVLPADIAQAREDGPWTP
ncbi:MAG: mono/diheme cytochrome c family protein/cytochrome c oxidase subunit IV [Myxococcota bacterium]|jgi:mono/diheme cytochrome c family protein/cytochrome c oxidase subunit IV